MGFRYRNNTSHVLPPLTQRLSLLSNSPIPLSSSPFFPCMFLVVSDFCVIFWFMPSIFIPCVVSYVTLMNYCCANSCKEAAGWCHGWYKEIVCICSEKIKRFCCTFLCCLHFAINFVIVMGLQCFDTVGWMAGRASSMCLFILYVYVCMCYIKWCQIIHCHSLHNRHGEDKFWIWEKESL